MPPKVQTSTARRGRPARAGAPGSAVLAAVLVPPKKRGRAAETSTLKTVAVEPPKKRGRPAKTSADEPIAQIDSAIKRGRRSIAAAEEVVAEASVPRKKRAGRPAKIGKTVVAEAAAPKKRAGRPRKVDIVPEAPATPKRRGRPALDLNRVAGSSRVAKRTSPRSKPTTRAPAKAAAAPRINPKIRRRHRVGHVEKVKKEAHQPVKKARGRPKKVDVEAEAPAHKKTVSRGRKTSAPIPAAPAKKVTARPKTAAPRKRRGYTSFEVADKFAAQVKQFITELQAEDAANAAAAAGEADDEEEDIEIEVELGPEDATADPYNNLLDEEKTEAEFAEDDEVDEGDHMLNDPADGTNETAVDQQHLAKDEDIAKLAPEIDNLDGETGLPSSTALHTEIAAVRNELGGIPAAQEELELQDAIQDDVQMTDVVQPEPEPERPSSSSRVSVDLHKEITEVTSIPQVDGSNEVDVFHVNVDEHIHEHVHAPEPVAVPSVGSLLGGL